MYGLSERKAALFGAGSAEGVEQRRKPEPPTESPAEPSAEPELPAYDGQSARWQVSGPSAEESPDSRADPYEAPQPEPHEEVQQGTARDTAEPPSAAQTTRVLPRPAAVAAARAAVRRSRSRRVADHEAEPAARVVRPAGHRGREGVPGSGCSLGPGGDANGYGGAASSQVAFGELDEPDEPAGPDDSGSIGPSVAPGAFVRPGGPGGANGRGRGREQRTHRAAASAAAGDEPRAGVPLSRGERVRLAVCERLPLWLQSRCAVDAKALGAMALVLLVAVGFGLHHFWSGRPQTVRPPQSGASDAQGPSAVHGVPSGGRKAGEGPEAGNGPAGAVSSPGAGPGASAGRRVVVDVAGKVRKPGVYRLKAGSRVTDALKAAGGVRRGTNLSGLNRARVLADGEQIVAGGGAQQAANGPRPVPGSGDGSGGHGAGASGSPVSLSSATEEQLDGLPGVGPVLAKHILEFRDQHGGFRSVDQLRNVNGIGERRFADLKSLVTP